MLESPKKSKADLTPSVFLVVICFFVVDLFYSTQVLGSTVLVGHRGGDTKLAPENTLACLSGAYSGDVWGNEIDVRTTEDGDLVLMHDSSVNRTTNGSGLVRDLSTSYIRTLDAGSWKGATFTGERVPLLEEALELIKSNNTEAYLDIKDAAASAVRMAVDRVLFPEEKLTFLIFSDAQAVEFQTEFPNAHIYRSFWNVEHSAATEKSLSRVASLGVDGVTIWVGHFSEEYLRAVQSRGMKLALVGKVMPSQQVTDGYIELQVDELWIDDLKANVEIRNNGEGELYLPKVSSATTVLVGHRGGAIGVAPENTLIGFSSNYSNGAWGHEVDVRTSEDGVAVLMRDTTVDRTTNGTGAVSDLSAAYITSLDAGSWKGAKFSGEKVPTLREALDFMKWNRTNAYLDIRETPASVVRRSVNEAGFAEERLTFLIFSDAQATEYITEFPDAKVYRSLWNVPHSAATEASLARLASIGVDGVTIWVGHHTAAYVEAAHSRGLKIALVGKSVESSSELDSFILSGVDELWLDDIRVNIELYNNGIGELLKPKSFAISSILGFKSEVHRFS